MNLYVGNLSYQTSEEDMEKAFASYGKVKSVAIIKDKVSGQSKGFGFVEMASDQEGRAAIEGMDGKDLRGRKLRVNEARPREDRFAGGGEGRAQDRGGPRGETQRRW